jgi:glucosamine kinase
MALFHDDPFEAVSWADKATATDYAKLAPLIIGHAEEGDHVGKHVLKYAAQEIDALARRLVSFGAGQIALLGGVAPRMAKFLAEDVRAHLVPSRGDALDGALLLARRCVAAEFEPQGDSSVSGGAAEVIHHAETEDPLKMRQRARRRAKNAP